MFSPEFELVLGPREVRHALGRQEPRHMANPMREKRTWPPDRDSDGETAAAFEAAVAVVKA